LVERPAARRPRLEDVAAAVGMSTASVSLVLRGAAGPSAATRDRVFEAAARLGYRPDRAASLLARRRSRLLGVVMDVRSSFHAELVEDAQEAADRHGYDLVISTVTRSHSERRAIETLLDSRCEALVLLGPESPVAELAALARQVPVVAVGRPVESGEVDVVRAADDEGVALAVDHLVGLGHRRIAYLDGGRGAIAGARRRGFRRAVGRHGLGESAFVLGAEGVEANRTVAPRGLLDRDPAPTAVVTFNDRAAVGLLAALLRAGVGVPQRMSVVGYDDDPLSRLAHVNLTTVSQDAHQQTAFALQAVVERLEDGRTEPREFVVRPSLVVRGTTAAPTGG
jgi:DNA-binding LacI/PurR family transcriptional regulator